MGERALAAEEEVTISSTCTVFAESEIVSLLARGQAVDPILRGLIRALVSRAAALAKSIQPMPPFMLSGGVAKNRAVAEFISHALSESVQLPEHPQLMGAYGAALLAAEGN
jgi:activator of 2-hydroxyglutaryl-CoA dehydratase